MRSPAAAIAWEFRQRHRWALIALAVYLLGVAIFKILTLESGPIELLPPNSLAAGLLVVPFSGLFFYFLALFSFGLAGDLAARQSIYPARMFALPVTNAALAGWPMLHGAAAMTILWLGALLLARSMGDSSLPLIWPGLLIVAFLAWTQVFTWMSYGLPGIRVIVTVLWLTMIDVIVIVAVEYKVAESTLVAFLAPQLPLAYLAACAIVARARRGEVPDWRWIFTRLGQIVGALTRRRSYFPSPASAQSWIEWRQYGRTLPALVAMVVPVELTLLFIPGNNTSGIVLYILAVVLLTPPFMAGFAAAAMSKANPSFISTRPLSSATLVAAKLKMTIWSTLATWLVVLVAVPLALNWSGTLPIVSERVTRGIDTLGTPRAIVVVLLVFLGLLASTWKHLMQNMFIGLSGRAWLIKSSMFLSLAFLTVLGPLAQWIHDSGTAQAAIFDALPWIPVVLVAVKMPAAAWIATRLHNSRLLSDRTMLVGAACWVVVVLAIYAVLVWLIDTPLLPRYWFLLVAILQVPLARLSAAPLALAWNRHR